jgi:hypothetical protein
VYDLLLSQNIDKQFKGSGISIIEDKFLQLYGPTVPTMTFGDFQSVCENNAFYEHSSKANVLIRLLARLQDYISEVSPGCSTDDEV